ncbi:hypothetical protein chiPu_0012894 [Chiloscyllium punctatum]|uniref:Uncharacterized protein n=1 Tax=Chiloscyllium punctatum TaxID=137246 RepID=A0A401SVK6_CHIPU|nr:hypothetical protein [Chiloscyllium punctatum]
MTGSSRRRCWLPHLIAGKAPWCRDACPDPLSSPSHPTPKPPDLAGDGGPATEAHLRSRWARLEGDGTFLIFRLARRSLTAKIVVNIYRIEIVRT